MHPRLQEVVDSITAVRAELARTVEQTPADHFTRRDRADRWSGAEIIEHLGRVEGSIGKLFEGLFAKGLAAGLPDETSNELNAGSLERLAGTRDRKVTPLVAPERLVPTPNADFVAAWASLQAARERTLRAVATVDGKDISVLKFPHPFFGELNGYEWVRFLGIHEARHLEQLKDTLQGT